MSGCCLGTGGRGRRACLGRAHTLGCLSKAESPRTILRYPEASQPSLNCVPHTLCTPSLTPPSLPFHAAFPAQATVTPPPTSLRGHQGGSHSGLPALRRPLCPILGVNLESYPGKTTPLPNSVGQEISLRPGLAHIYVHADSGPQSPH